jgi:aspartate/methionine/tyrosine aminotransferase
MTTSRSSQTFSPPVMEARRWIDGITFPKARPLLNLSQAAPTAAPPKQMRQIMAQAILDQSDAHLYGSVLGREDLRAALAANICKVYGAEIRPEQVAITAGCNQAFAAAITALCTDGDEVIIPTPWYFNHKMWLDMSGVHSCALHTNDNLLPDPEQARALISPKTKAIALVSPNNPAGVEYPPALLSAFFELCQEAGIKLILDETYRDFHSSQDAPHTLFSRPNWDDTLIDLYSFSKSYRLTGHRIGAITTSPKILAEAEKFLDTVAICPSQVGQIAATWGLQNLSDWLASERLEILKRRAAVEEGFAILQKRGWHLKGVGAYFAYVEHPFDIEAEELAKSLVTRSSILCLPGTMFHPKGSKRAAKELRMAFANIDKAGIFELFDRLARL